MLTEGLERTSDRSRTLSGGGGRKTREERPVRQGGLERSVGDVWRWGRMESVLLVMMAVEELERR